MNNEPQVITLDQAKALGIEFVFINKDDEWTTPLDEATDYIETHEYVYPAKPLDHLRLSPEWIIEDACCDLHEEAYSRVVDSNEFKEFEAACAKLCIALESETTTYDVDKTRIIKLK